MTVFQPVDRPGSTEIERSRRCMLGSTFTGVVGKVNRLVVGVVATAVLLPACGDDAETSTDSAPDGSSVSVRLREWSVGVDSATVDTGEVVFEVVNEGNIEHEFVVVRTEIADGKIPLAGDRFDEETEGVEVVGELPEVPAGSSMEFPVNLSSGVYQLVCNLPGHYQAGMHTSFTVTE